MNQRSEIEVRREMVKLKLNEVASKVKASIEDKARRIQEGGSDVYLSNLQWDRNNLAGKLVGINEARAIVDAWL